MMMRRVIACHRILTCALRVEALQTHHLRTVFPLSKHQRWCHQPPTYTQPTKALESVSSVKTDTFLEEIKGLNTLEEMVTCIENNKGEVQSCHLEQVFSKLYLLTKEHPSIADELQTEKAFAVLCQYTLKHIRQFSKVEIVYLLRALCWLKVPLDCNLGQASLQMLRHYINSISLSHITLLDDLLSNQPSNALVDALKKALPLALETQIKYQLDPSNLWLVLNCLSMATRHKMDSGIIQDLATIVYQNVENLSKAKTVHAVLSLSFVKPLPPSLMSTVIHLLRRLNYLVMGFSEKELAKIIIALRNRRLFDSKLLSSLSHRCCTENWDLPRTTLLLSVFNEHKFLSTSVLNWVLESLEKDPSPLWEDERVSLLTLCQAFSEANHNIDRKNFTYLIGKCKEKLKKMEQDSPELLVRLTMHLAILESVPLDLLEQVFQPEFISKAMKRVAERDQVPSLLQCYLALEQSARLDYCSSYRGPFLPPDMLREAIRVRATVMKPIDIVLQQFLEVGLGGSQFMLTGLWTRLGHFIDHLVVMHKDDFPLRVDNDKSLAVVPDSEGFAFVEDVVLPEGSKILAVLVARQEWFNKDPPRLRGWMSFQQKILAKMGYNPVIIGPPTTNAEQIQDIDCRLESESY